MRIYGITSDAPIAAAAQKIGIEARAHRADSYRRTANTFTQETCFKVKLSQTDEKRFAHGFSKSAVCIHGHARFIYEFLKKNPSARVHTSMGVYDGWEGFLRNQTRIATSAFKKFQKATLCECKPDEVSEFWRPRDEEESTVVDDGFSFRTG